MRTASRNIFGPEHSAFRDQARRYLEKEMAPLRATWEWAQCVSRAAWRGAGEQGLLCCWMPERDGGPGADLLYDLIVCEELARLGMTGPGFPLHSLVVAPYISRYGTVDLRRRLLPAMVSGELIGAIAMTEPGAGSDLAGIRTSASKHGDEWQISGQKTFITNGSNCDVVIVACKTEPTRGAKGISLFAVTSDMPGFKRGRTLRKIGQHAQDTSELFFDQVRVSEEHLLGDLNMGFGYMMQELPQKRLLVSVQCQARAEAAFDLTSEFVKQRMAFKKRIADFQNTRFKLAALWADLQAGRAYCDQLIQQHLNGDLDPVCASAGKLWHSELLGRVTDECLQLHGGYGYMEEYPIARAYADARVERIYGGTSEIMKEIISRSICDVEP